jgi:polar amino acid transport system substrate-binding protein
VKVVIAYIEEPPFGWTGADGSATGADIELADAVLRAIGVTHVEHRLTTFAELLPGVQSGRWDMNVPLFVTPERMAKVAFSVPVWAIGDGFLVRSGNPKALNSYESVARRADARLGVIVGQVQHRSAQTKGVRDAQILLFEEQAQAIAAIESGEIDAYASTALGNRIVAERIGLARVEAVTHSHEAGAGVGGQAPVGAFSFGKGNRALVDAVNAQLRAYLGSAEHRERMARFGLSEREIDPVLR